MNAVDYLKEKKRMCDTIDCCEACPMKGCKGCGSVELIDPYKAVDIVETWVKENRYMNADKFRDVFGLEATEVWAMLNPDFSSWLNSDYIEPVESEAEQDG